MVLFFLLGVDFAQKKMKSLILVPLFLCCELLKNRGDDTQTRFADLGELDHSATVFPHDDALDLSPSILSFLF